MKEILLINPRPKMKGRKKMAKKKVATKTKKTRKYRKNPSNPPKKRSRARATAGKLFKGLNFKSAIGGILAGTIGMFAAKFGAKRFGGGGSELDPASWSWRTYLQAAAGATLAGLLVNMVRPGMGQRVLEGGMLLVGYKLLQNELIAKNPTATNYLGQDDGLDILEGYNGYGQNEGMMLDLDGTPYLLGQGEPLPLDERHRGVIDDDLPEIQVGDTMVPVGPLGDTMVPVGPLGFGDPRSSYLEQYKKAWS